MYDFVSKSVLNPDAAPERLNDPHLWKAIQKNKYAGFEGHKHTVVYIRLSSLQELLTSVSGKVWTDSATGKLLRENGLVEVGKDGHTAKSKFPKLGRFVPLNKENLEKQAKIRK